MVECAYIFPGQGAQYVGMGKELYENYQSARDVFKQANRALGFDIARLCFEGPKEELTQTENCQPAILTVSVAALKAFATKNKKFVPKVALGLSLGEYSALVAADSIAFGDAVRLVRLRGQFMEEAAKEFPGKMASVLGFPKEKVERICQSCGVEIANFNSPDQIVISGLNESIDKAVSLIKSEKGKIIFLKCSGAFHSSLMSSAGQKLKGELSKVAIFKSEFPVISNVTATPQTEPHIIVENLIDQVSCSTRWEESIRYVASQKIDTFIEIGPGKVLKGLIQRINPELKVYNIEKPADIDNLLGISSG